MILTSYCQLEKVSPFGKQPLSLALADGFLLSIMATYYIMIPHILTSKLVFDLLSAFLSMFMPPILFPELVQFSLAEEPSFAFFAESQET